MATRHTYDFTTGLQAAKDAMTQPSSAPKPQTDAWQPIETAPRDGTEILVELRPGFGVPAYWDAELKTFVLSRPLHVESVREPTGWKPRWGGQNQGPKPGT